jgi:flagellar protein FliS
MRNHGYQNYLDNEILAASPLKLIEMLYDGALDSIAAARRHMRGKDIPARTRAINKALRIVTELACCLNHEAGGDLSRKLSGIYGYVTRLLIAANTKQLEAPLAEAEGLLATLADGWKTCSPCGCELDLPDSDLLRPDAYVASDAQTLMR